MITCEFENGSKTSLRHATVAVIIKKDGKVLLGKRGTYKGRKIPEFGKWALIGGYIDRDENSSQTAVREALEESGWKIANVKLLRINDNPNRPHEDKQNIEFCFIAEAVEETGEGDEEMSELKWFDLGKLPPKEKIAFDHFENLELYKKYLVKQFVLPVLGMI